MIKVLQPKFNEVALYETVKEQMIIQKEATLKQLQLVRERGDAIIDWGGVLGTIVEQVDGKFIQTAFDPIIANIEKGFNDLIAKFDRLIEEAKNQSGGQE